MTRRAAILVAALLGVPAAPGAAQPPAVQAPAAQPAAAQPATAQSPPAPSPSATAYFEFVRGRHLESVGQITEALEAYRLAAAADPGSAAIPAEIATLNARAN